jgi:hypothetical protein
VFLLSTVVTGVTTILLLTAFLLLCLTPSLPY